MYCYKKYLFLVIYIFTLPSIAQVIDEDVISMLTPEQISMASDLYQEKNPLTEVEELSQTDLLIESEESLVQDIAAEDEDDNSIKKYGYDFFSSMPTSLTAIGDLPLPNDYKVSLRDQFTIILTGSKERIFDLEVKLDGTILFPELGSISVAGLTFKEVKEKLTTIIDQSFIGVNIDISLKNLSAKKITIVGAVKTPGTYLVNPFSTITSALAYSGGISEIGSLRNIKLIRNGGEIFSFDLYDLLIRGDRSNDITIEAGDTLLINAASQFVEITGEIKRPAIYEILINENLNDIIEFSQGFTNVANRSSVSVAYLDLKNSLLEKKVVRNLEENLENVVSVEVFEIGRRNTSNIQVMGAVEKPGFYELDKYKNLNDLLKELQFVDVYPWLAVLEQFDEDKMITITTLFSLKDKSTYQDVELLPNSKVYFANIPERLYEVSDLASTLIDDYSLILNHNQGTFKLPVIGNFKVNDFVDLLGLDMTDVDSDASYVSPLESKVIVSDYKEMAFVSQKYHTVSFRSPVNDLITVNISGAVDYPGEYFLNANSSLEDLYELVGSFKNEAFLDGVVLQRLSVKERQLKAIESSEAALNKSILFSMQQGEDVGDISIFTSLAESIEPENLGRIAGNFSPLSNSSKNTILFDGDKVIIPKISNVINIIGAVLNPIAFEYSEKMRIESAIELAGGYQAYADKRRVYVIKANGLVEKSNRNIFQGNHSLQPGDTVVVPRKINTNSSVIQSLAPIMQILSDLSFSAAALDNLTDS